jgi:hypothetical protein
MDQQQVPPQAVRRPRLGWLRGDLRSYAKDCVRHPVVLLVLGALVTSYLIPSFTRRWQDHQKALEVRSDLASQIAASATSAVIRSDAIHEAIQANKKAQISAADDKAWLVWQIQSAALEARLTAYISKRGLAHDWAGYMQEVDVFHQFSFAPKYDPEGLRCLHASLLATSPAARAVEGAARREIHLGEIERMTKPRRFTCASELPIVRAARTWKDPPEYEYFLVEDELSARRTELIGQVLDSKIRAF